MLNEIYNKRILELASDIPHGERLDAPDASATAVSKLCGSKVTVDVKLDADDLAAIDAASAPQLTYPGWMVGLQSDRAPGSTRDWSQVARSTF